MVLVLQLRRFDLIELLRKSGHGRTVYGNLPTEADFRRVIKQIVSFAAVVKPCVVSTMVLEEV
jgi:hypothetical protein